MLVSWKAKKGKIIKKKQPLAQTTVTKRMGVDFWQHKTAEELANEQGIKPVKDEEDFKKRFLGGLEEWDDIDEFLKEAHRPWK